MTSRAQKPLVRGSHSEISQLFVNKCKTKKSVRRRNKKPSKTSSDVQFKEFSLTKQKDLERTISELQNHYQTKSDKLKKRKSKSVVRKCCMRTKNHYRERKIWFKQKSRDGMNYEWIGKIVKKKIRSKKSKKSKKSK